MGTFYDPRGMVLTSDYGTLLKKRKVYKQSKQRLEQSIPCTV